MHKRCFVAYAQAHHGRHLPGAEVALQPCNNGWVGPEVEAHEGTAKMPKNVHSEKKKKTQVPELYTLIQLIVGIKYLKKSNF